MVSLLYSFLATDPNLCSSEAFSLIGNPKIVVIISFSDNLPSQSLFLYPSFMGMGLVIQDLTKLRVMPKSTSFRVGGHAWWVAYCWGSVYYLSQHICQCSSQAKNVSLFLHLWQQLKTWIRIFQSQNKNPPFSKIFYVAITWWSITKYQQVEY